MDLDTVFSILFLVVIVGLQLTGGLIKKARNRGNPGETVQKDRPGLFDAILRRIKKEIEAARAAATTPPQPAEKKSDGRASMGWEALMPESPARQEPEPATRTPLSAFDDNRGDGETDLQHSPTGEPSDPITVTATGQGASSRPKPRATTPPASSTLYGEPQKATHTAYSQAGSSSFMRRPPGRERILELRRAVVWTEIFAPPLALRQDQDNR
ncbi:MAG: hypothetical protein SWH68_09090 [Thermodesulfobacteriota bacterium]|nr:hypothetical protein [Thermodesulfobacteriota bacterium]